ncbi:MAG: hypothetical protein F6K16_38150, partial [Symploca sp. SIO2B6]|nr:hypothetical protein [Symploca sp. SIO2B6]
VLPIPALHPQPSEAIPSLSLDGLGDEADESLINEPLIIDEPLVNESPISESPVNESLVNESLVNVSPINESPVNESPINVSTNPVEGNGGTSGGDRSILSILAPVPSTPSPLLDSTQDKEEAYAIDQETDGVVIPVILPADASASLPSQTPSPVAVSRAVPTVPNPDISSPDIPNISNDVTSSLPSIAIAASPDNGTVLPTRTRPTFVPPSHLIPVPGMQIPEGHLGSLSTVPVQDDGLNNALLSAVPNLPMTGVVSHRQELRYRVLVVADTYADRAFVSSLIPDAFLTYVEGRAMMQVGAYRQLENANEIAYQFVNQGLQVEVQRMN